MPPLLSLSQERIAAEVRRAEERAVDDLEWRWRVRTPLRAAPAGLLTVSSAARPNKRLKLAGPALRGTVRLCTSLQIPQGGALAPAGARPAA